MLKSLLVSTSFILASLVCSPARAAEDTTKAFELTIRGAEGLWMPIDMARQNQAEVEELRKLRPVIEEQAKLLANKDERLDIKDARILQVREALDLSMLAEERLNGVVEAAVRGERRAEEELDVWYRTPTFLISVGVVGILVLETVTVVVYKALERQ